MEPCREMEPGREMEPDRGMEPDKTLSLVSLLQFLSHTLTLLLVFLTPGCWC